MHYAIALLFYLMARPDSNWISRNLLGFPDTKVNIEKNSGTVNLYDRQIL